MAQPLGQLTNPKTTAQMRQQLLDALQGRSVVTRAPANTGSGSISISGTPSAAYDGVQVKIASGGEPGAATFQYSIDGGASWTSPATVPASGATAVGTTGVAVAFAAGPSGAGTSFIAGDVFAFALSVPSFPVTSWQPDSTPRALVEIDAQELADLTSLVAAVARSGFVTTQPGVTGASGAWLDLAAQNVYGLTRNPSVATIGQVTLTDAAGAGPFNIAAGSVWVGATATLATSSPRRFLNTTGGTLPQGGTLTITVAAEAPGSAYNVANGAVTTLLTSLPGVTVANSPGSGSWITQQGTDVESDIALSTRCMARWPSVGIGATAATFDLWARTASAEVTRTKVQASGASTNVSGANASTSNILVASSAGFVVGGLVKLTTPGSYHVVTAVPDATHVTISPNAAAAPTTGSLDLASGGQVDIYVAGSSGAVSGGALAAVQAYIATRLPVGVTQNTQNATPLTITIGGTVFASAGQLTTAQAAVAAALQALVAATPIGGVLYYSKVIQAINDATGVRNSSGVTVNLGTIDLTLNPSQVASSLTNSLGWVGV